jgi:hypothetical protein
LKWLNAVSGLFRNLEHAQNLEIRCNLQRVETGGLARVRCERETANKPLRDFKTAGKSFNIVADIPTSNCDISFIG